MTSALADRKEAHISDYSVPLPEGWAPDLTDDQIAALSIKDADLYYRRAMEWYKAKVGEMAARRAQHIEDYRAAHPRLRNWEIAEQIGIQPVALTKILARAQEKHEKPISPQWAKRKAEGRTGRPTAAKKATPKKVPRKSTG